MQCLNHPAVEAKFFCQNCGKPMCAECVRRTPSGHILCEQCLATAQPDANQAFWQAAQAYVTNAQGVPNPSAAAVLGLIPGVGAMYNGQLFKGLIHVVIFAVLVSMTQSYGVFGIFIGAWVLYQSFEAYQTAKARRDGTPLPDPFGLNELGGWLNLGSQGRHTKPGQPGQPGPGQVGPSQPGPVWADPAAQPVPPAQAAGETPAYGAPYTPPGPAYTPPAAAWGANPGVYPDPAAYPNPGAYPDPNAYPGANPTPGYTVPPYTEPYAGYPPNPDPYAGNYPPGYPPPPIPPVPPYGWRGREPAWAIILIILGLVFLFKTLGFVGHLFHYAWPVLLIGFGVWLIVRRVGTTQGGPK